MTLGIDTRPVAPTTLALARGLRIVAIAAFLALLALLADARFRAKSREPAVLLPVPEERAAAAVPTRAPGAEPVGTTGAFEPGGAASATIRAEAAAPEPPAQMAPRELASAPAKSAAGEPISPDLQPAPVPVRGSVRDGVLAYQAGDYARAYAIWRQLAEAGNARARFHLGALYLEGRLGPPDYARAYRWLALAAEAGQNVAIPLRDQAAKALAPETVAAIRRELGLAPSP
ncbi:MAG: hypothetical protein RMK73_03560 [Geminicoccaceae bacterium]|nr:hypothetical protein [Geminicoccaceae bacterium]MDW8340543.1 hypothetical protein [Geminicoccaceae bacterium]